MGLWMVPKQRKVFLWFPGVDEKPQRGQKGGSARDEASRFLLKMSAKAQDFRNNHCTHWWTPPLWQSVSKCPSDAELCTPSRGLLCTHLLRAPGPSPYWSCAPERRRVSGRAGLGPLWAARLQLRTWPGSRLRERLLSNRRAGE